MQEFKKKIIEKSLAAATAFRDFLLSTSNSIYGLPLWCRKQAFFYFFS